MIHIIDYGLGNAQAFSNMFKRLGYESIRAKSTEDLHNVEKIILPGVVTKYLSIYSSGNILCLNDLVGTAILV